MTLSRHAQVENLSGLLHLRRTEQRTYVRRQSAYVHLVGTLLDSPLTEIELTSPITSLPLHVAAQPHTQAA
jgi:hypothetical protein